MKLKTLLILSIIVLLSCERENTYHAERKFVPYVEEFKYQASIRGVKISFDGLVIQFKEMGGNPDAYYDPNTHKIYVDTTTFKWRVNAEELMMHELGHAVLNREHLYDFMAGDPWLKKSVMGYLTKPIFSTQKILMHREEYYYDELFDIDTPVPDWAN